jgi:hypothetical protein
VTGGARKVVWIEPLGSRCMGTGAGTFMAYEGEFVLLVAGPTLEACQRLFCDMLRTRGEFKPDE